MNKVKTIATNVFYITSSCNLRCEYCYERKGRPDKSMTKDEVDTKLKWMDDNLADNSHIVIFGGEPLLEIDLIEYIINELITTYKHRNFSVSMDTNGTLLLDDNIFNKYKNIISKRQFSTFVSYDGPHSFRRRDINGNCVNDKIVEVLKKLENNNIKYNISYTWQKENDPFIIYDMIYICENFKPEKIVISPDCTELDTVSDLYYGNYIKTKIPYFEAVFLEYKIPICEFTCRICRKCQFNTKNVYYLPQKDPIIADKRTEKAFSFWD